MRPVLFNLWVPWAARGITVYSYPAAQLAALVLTVAVGVELCRREGMGRWRALTPFLVGIPVGLVGARVLAELNAGAWAARGRWDASWYWSALGYWHGGKAAYGGLLAGVASGLVAARAERLPAARFADAIAPALALGALAARVGCFLAGCCYGKPTSLPLAVRFPAGHPGMAAAARAGAAGLHPTQLYLAAAALTITVLLLALRRAALRPGCRFCLFALLYGTATFAVEFLRGDPGRGELAGLSTAQWISLLVVGGGSGWLWRRWREQQAAAAAGGGKRASSRVAAGLSVVLVASIVSPWLGGQAGAGVRGPSLARAWEALLRGDYRAAAELGAASSPSSAGGQSSAAALFARGVACIVRGDVGEAVDSLARAAHSPAEPAISALAGVALGRTLLWQGRASEAEDAFRSVLERHSDSTLADDAALGVARAQAMRGDLRAAHQQIAAALNRYARRGKYLVPRRGLHLRWEDLLEGRAGRVARSLERLLARGGAASVRQLREAAFELLDRHAEPELRRLRRHLVRVIRATGDAGSQEREKPGPLARPAGGPPGTARRDVERSPARRSDPQAAGFPVFLVVGLAVGGALLLSTCRRRQGEGAGR